MELDEALALAQQYGFSHCGPIKMDALQFLPEVRDMCAAGTCRQYGRCWSCPPACGTLEEAARRARRFSKGLLVQSTGQM